MGTVLYKMYLMSVSYFLSIIKKLPEILDIARSFHQNSEQIHGIQLCEHSKSRLVFFHKIAPTLHFFHGQLQGFGQLLFFRID